MADLKISLGKITLKNPILLASGTASQGLELNQMMDLSHIGGIVGKTITKEPRLGNPSPRVIETPAGMLNTIGLQNPGIDGFEKEYLREIEKLPVPFIASMAGYKDEEWEELAKKLDRMSAVVALELNFSCPNVKTGLVVGTSPEEIHRTIGWIKNFTSKPLFAKLTPNVTNIAPLAKAAQEAGADGISLINTILGMSVNWKKRKSNLSATMAGLSGPAIKPIALRFVYQAAKAVDIPILGIGGISKADDILEFMVAGASAVQVGTALFVDPFCLLHLSRDLEKKLDENGIPSIRELVGSFEEG